jgi:pilus assembly protein Flp/PilA
MDMKASIVHFARDTSGATAIEYAMIAAGISIVIIAVVGQVGGKLSGIFGQVVSLLP